MPLLDSSHWRLCKFPLKVLFEREIPHQLFLLLSVLYGNKIKDLPSGVFKGLTSLQLLLLNANEIECIRRDAFRDLHSLSLLSLYDNNLQSLANGTFEQMKSIQTL